MLGFRSFHLAQKLFFQPVLVAAAASLLTKVLLRGWLHKGIFPTHHRRRVPGKLSARYGSPKDLAHCNTERNETSEAVSNLFL